MFLPYAYGVVADAVEKLGDVIHQVSSRRRLDRELLASYIFDVQFELTELATELELAIDEGTGENPGQ